MEQNRIKPLILLVEDEGLLSRMYSKKLISDGYDCLVASNGEEGVKMAKESHPDLIVCDVMMPVKDGISVLRDLKADDVAKDIPVIMLSNLSDEKYVEQALELGAVSYLVKNLLVPADVVSKIKETLDAYGKRTLLSKSA